MIMPASYGSENGISVKDIAHSFQSGNGTFTRNGDSFTVTFSEPGICSVPASFEGGNESEATPSDITGSATAVALTIVCPNATKEATNSGDFVATVKPKGISANSYEWIWEAPEEAGYNPSVNFENSDKNTTKALKAHWFALPDDRLNAAFSCKYDIRCKAKIGNFRIPDLEGNNDDTIFYFPILS